MIKKLFSSLTRQQAIKIVSFLVIVGLFFVLPTFAQNTTDTTATKDLNRITEFLQNVIALCSRGWVVLAILAGKLMTNDFVYGSFIHMDIYLWKIWNIMKNFANFALIALVLGSIVKNFIGKEAIDVKKIITNTLLAGILIQASWFMVGALIDLSTVATVAISGFPSSFIQSNVAMKKNMNDNAEAFNSNRLIINMNTNSKDSITSIPTKNPNPNAGEDLWETFLPTSNSISGPFVYLGMGIFQFQEAMSIGTGKNAVTLSLTFALRFVLIFFFTVALLLLFIANIMRIGLLRVFIIGAPFLVLILLFKVKTGDGIGKLFSLPNLMTLVFKPVIFVAGMSIMLIIVMSMHSVLMDSGAQLTNINGITFDVQTGSSTMSLEGISNVEMQQNDLFGKDVLGKGQNAFAMLLVMFLAMFLMWRMVKLSLTFGSGPIEKVMENLTEKAERLAKSLPVLPFKGGASFNAVKGFTEQQKMKMTEGFGMNTEGKFVDAERDFQQMIDAKMNIKSSWSAADYNDLNRVLSTNPDNFFSESINIAKDREGGLSLSNSSWRATLETYLKKRGSSVFTMVNLSEKNIFDQYFKGDNIEAQKNRLLLHEKMGGNKADNKSTERKTGTPISEKQLTENIYHGKGDETTNTADAAVEEADQTE